MLTNERPILYQPDMFERTVYLIQQIADTVDRARETVACLEQARAKRNPTDMAAALLSTLLHLSQVSQMSESLSAQIRGAVQQ